MEPILKLTVVPEHDAEHDLYWNAACLGNVLHSPVTDLSAGEHQDTPNVGLQISLQ